MDVTAVLKIVAKHRRSAPWARQRRWKLWQSIVGAPHGRDSDNRKNYRCHQKKD